MPKTRRNQRNAKRRRLQIRTLRAQLGIKRAIILRHEKGTRQNEVTKKKQPSSVYQVVLLRGPTYGYQMNSWVEAMMLWCDKTERQAESIIDRAVVNSGRMPWEENNPPVIVSTSSMSDAERHKINLSESISSTALKVIRKAPAKVA